MSRTRRTALQTAVDDGGYFVRRAVCFAATPSRDLPYAIGSFVTEASPPKGNGFAAESINGADLNVFAFEKLF